MKKIIKIVKIVYTWSKVFMKLITILPVVVEGIKKIVDDAKKQLEEVYKD